jgi:hypothetical protein
MSVSNSGTRQGAKSAQSRSERNFAMVATALAIALVLIAVSGREVLWRVAQGDFAADTPTQVTSSPDQKTSLSQR